MDAAYLQARSVGHYEPQHQIREKIEQKLEENRTSLCLVLKVDVTQPDYERNNQINNTNHVGGGKHLSNFHPPISDILPAINKKKAREAYAEDPHHQRADLAQRKRPNIFEDYVTFYFVTQSLFLHESIVDTEQQENLKNNEN